MAKTAMLLAWVPALWLAGCAVEFENTRAAREMELRSRPAGSVYLGWRVFEDKCARCHGASATGQGDAPDLLARLRTMGPREFADLVLLRYEWTLPAGSVPPRSAERQATIDELLQRRQGALTMPAWQGEPRVTAHVIDLYAYLSARADGSQAAGRPAGP